MDSMNFGLGRFLEMFEGRFGRAATTALLAMIGLAIVTFTGRLILDGLVLPIYNITTTVINGHWSFVSLLKEFLTSQALPFFNTSLWVIFLAWISNIVIHDVYTLSKRRQLMRDSKSKWMEMIDVHNMYRWIKAHEDDAKDIIVRLDNEAKGSGPIVDDAFLVPLMYRIAGVPPPPASAFGAIARSVPDPTNPPVALPPSPTPQGTPGKR